MRIKPDSLSFNLLLAALSTLPTFGIDMILPALSATGASLGVPASEVGLAMSVFLLTVGITPLILGPLSDLYGRKPVMIFGFVTLIIASLGCALAGSLADLLAWRVVQAIGCSGAMMVFAIVRDLFDGEAARTKMSHVVVAINLGPMIGPSVGAGLLALGGWRVIYLVLVVAGLILLPVILFGFTESAKIDPAGRLSVSTIVRDYLQVLAQPVCRGYILVNASAHGAVFAYITGSPLFFINIVGLRPDQYGLIFSATAAAIITGAFINGRMSAAGKSPIYPLTIGLGLLPLAATSLMIMTLTGWMPVPLVILLIVIGAFTFGLISPNATSGAMQPLPQLSGSVGAVNGSAMMVAAGGSSVLVSILFDGHTALSMAMVMTAFSVLAISFYLRIVRPAERVSMAV